MKKMFVIGFCFLAFILIGLLLGFVRAREPVLTRYPIEHVFDCKVLDSSNTLYLLRSDVFSDKGACFRITGENIVFDGGGNEVIFDGSSENGIGVFAKNSDNVSVKNMKISGFDQGVVFDGVSNSFLSDIISVSNAFSGITIRNSFGNVVSNNIMKENGDYGILVSSGSDNSLSGNIVKYTTQGLLSGVGIGISLEDGSGNYLFNNSVEFNDMGIYLKESDFNELRENKARLNSKRLSDNGQGIYLSRSRGNLIEENLLERNEGGGIYFLSSTDNIASGNIIKNHDEKGITLDKSEENILLKNILDTNINGFFLSSSSNNNITEGEITNSYNDGIYIEGESSGNNFNDINVIGTNPDHKDINFDTFDAEDSNLANNAFGKYNLGGNYISFLGSNGKIKFLKAVFGEGSSLMKDIRIERNLIVIDSEENLGLDKPSEITFYDINPNNNSKIYRNGAICPPNLCQNMTSLEGPTVVIRAAKSGSYSILSG